MRKLLNQVLVVFIFTLPFIVNAQSHTRIHSGIGVQNDISAYYAVDYGSFLLDENSKFNIGGHIGGYFYTFKNKNLNKNNKIYGLLNFILKYRLTNKFSLQIDSGTKISLGKSNLFMLDEMNEKIPDSRIASHAYTMPLIDYKINDTIAAFIGYQIVFENTINMDSFSFGLRFLSK